MNRLLRGIVFLAALLSISVPAFAQELGTIAGSAKDVSGAFLPGVTIEAASPALIEKVRSVVTDGSGQYRIINLPPGTYSVTFSLTGFSNVRREGVEVSIGVTAQVNAELKVGAVAETITVTGEAPVVDVQSASQTRAVTAQAFKELPSGGSWVQMAALVPAVRAQNTDVGGVLGDQTGAQVSAHGSLNGDGVSLIDGMRIGNMYLASNLTNMSLSPLLFDEVNVQLSGQIAETGTNGVIMNAIPRSGGNRFSGTFLGNGSGPSLQSSNITSNLQARGTQNASTTLKKLYDINGAVGGPVMKDKLWFYATSRYFTNEYYLASRFYAVDPAAIIRTPDTSRQAYAGTYTYDNNGRLTWSINDKQKLSGFYAYQYKVDPHWLLQIFNASPEAVRITTWHTQLSTTKWTYAATNKLLFELGVMAGGSPDTIKLDPDQVQNCPAQGTLAARCISITDQANGNLVSRAPGGIIGGFDFDDRLPSQSFTGSMTYVTGSHSFKVGFEDQRGHFWRGDNNDSTGGLWYTYNGKTPVFVTVNSPAFGYQNNLNYNLGIYAQDRWTMRRMTLAGGIRLDMQNESTEPFTAGPHRWLPTRNIPFGAVENVPSWKDINPRVSFAYDLFGNGKTALKASASRGVQQDSIGTASANNPAATLATTTQRTWNDAFYPVGDPRNGNNIPDCDLTSGAINGECGAWQTANFGSTQPVTTYSPAIMNGWGVRPWNWEFSAGVQQEIAPRVSLSVGYFRRIYGNFQITDNEALAASDFTQYAVTAPSNAGGFNGAFTLPNAGQVVNGFYDVNAIIPARNVVKDASTYGAQLQHWNGVDVSVDARLRSTLYIQAGVSTGKTMTDNCAIAAQAPEVLTVAGVLTPLQYCHQETPWQPQYKALAAYTLPYGIRVSGTLQSLPGPNILASNIYNANNRTTLTTLGRPFTLAQANVNLLAPNDQWGDRLNQVDFRFTKILNMGRAGKVDLDVDLYNAFNSDAVLTELGTFGPVWRLPTTVIQPRFVKFQVRYDF